MREVPVRFPKVLGNGLLGRGAIAGKFAVINVSDTLFSSQIVALAETTLDLDAVIHDARHSECKPQP